MNVRQQPETVVLGYRLWLAVCDLQEADDADFDGVLNNTVQLWREALVGTGINGDDVAALKRQLRIARQNGHSLATIVTAYRLPICAKVRW